MTPIIKIKESDSLNIGGRSTTELISSSPLDENEYKSEDYL